jgi:hypothetical protein
MACRSNAAKCEIFVQRLRLRGIRSDAAALSSKNNPARNGHSTGGPDEFPPVGARTRVVGAGVGVAAVFAAQTTLTEFDVTSCSLAVVAAETESLPVFTPV